MRYASRWTSGNVCAAQANSAALAAGIRDRLKAPDMDQVWGLAGACIAAITTLAFVANTGRRDMVGGAVDDVKVTFETMTFEGREYPIWVLPVSVAVQPNNYPHFTITELRLIPHLSVIKITFTPARQRVSRNQLPDKLLRGLDPMLLTDAFEDQEDLSFPVLWYLRRVTIEEADAKGLRGHDMPPYPAVDSDMYTCSNGLMFKDLLESIQFRESVKMRRSKYGDVEARADATVKDWGLQPGGIGYRALLKRNRSEMEGPLPASVEHDVPPTKRISAGPHPFLRGSDPDFVMPGHDVWSVHNQRRVAAGLPEIRPRLAMRNKGAMDGDFAFTGQEEYVTQILTLIRDKAKWTLPGLSDAYHAVRVALAKHFPVPASQNKSPNRRPPLNSLPTANSTACPKCEEVSRNVESSVKDAFKEKFFVASGRGLPTESEWYVEESDGTPTPLGEIWREMITFFDRLGVLMLDEVEMSPRVMAKLHVECFDENFSPYALHMRP